MKKILLTGLLFVSLPVMADQYTQEQTFIQNNYIYNSNETPDSFIEMNTRPDYNRPLCSFGFKDENGVKMRSYITGKVYPGKEKHYLRWLIRNNCPIPDRLLGY